MASTIQSANLKDKLYSTSFLRQHETVRQELIKEGFTEITFFSEDGLKLSGLLLSRPNAKYNVITCAGFYPGKKEGMATFYSLLPDDCNILLFDARGRGDSEGPLVREIPWYGINEYKDITGAISYLNKQNDLPIFLIGLCSGAFNAAQALIHLEKKNKAASSKIKGLIFDSGWRSVIKTTRSSSINNINKVILLLLKPLYKKNEIAKNSYLYKTLSACNSYCSTIIHTLCAKPIFSLYDHITNLTDKIDTISSPIFFIHSYNDYIRIEEAMHLSKFVANKQCWWIKQSPHACHHLAQKELYKAKVTEFINSNLQQEGCTNC
jgi:pimeloyl-ACP methyl ester carboxylesterase